jgi:chromosome segregation protein
MTSIFEEKMSYIIVKKSPLDLRLKKIQSFIIYVRLGCIIRMFLKEIAITGFKSFANTTRIQLRPGVTCIVGPNGCGKSNIVDALRWVLGEQSAKALRGGKMQDVIFEGTDLRRPAQICEVALTFSDCEDQLGTAFHEIEVKRRVARDGGSDYFLNGKSCRLKDIQMLFMDTGIGRVAYSFLVQGQIDQILSTDPSERRLIFEEASGISKYKAQRQETLQKLKEVDLNLLRLNDVIAPLEAQQVQLKGHAQKAAHYQKIYHRLQHLEWALFAHESQTLQATIQRLQAESAPLALQLNQEKEALERFQHRLEALKQEKSSTHETIQALQRDLRALQQEEVHWTQQNAIAQTQSTEATARLEGLLNQSLKFEAEKAHFEALFAEEAQAISPLKAALEAKEKDQSALKPELQKALQVTRDLERDLQSLRAKQSALYQERDRLERSTHQQNAQLQTLSAQTQQTEAFYNEQAQSLVQAEGQADSSAEKLTALTQSHQEAQAGIETFRKEITEKRSALQASETAITPINRKQTELRTEIQLLEGWLNRFEGTSLSTQKILKGEVKGCPKGAVEPLIQAIEVPETYTKAAEAALGFAADALLPSDPNQTLSLWNSCQEAAVGAFSMAWPMPTASKTPDHPENFTPFTEFVQCTSPQWAAWVEHFFEGVYLVDDLQLASAYALQNPHFLMRLCVTPDGKVLDSRGLAYVQTVQTSGILEKKNKLKALKEALTAQEQMLLEAKAQHIALEASFRELQTLSQSHQDRLSQTQAAHQSALAEQKVFLNEIQKLKLSTQKLAQEKVNLGQRAQQAKGALEKLEIECTTLSESIQKTRETLQHRDTLLSAQRTASTTLDHSLRDAQLALSEARQTILLKEQAHQSTQQTIQRLAQQILQNQRERETILQHTLSIDATLQAAAGKLIPLKEAQAQHQDALLAQETAFAQIEQNLSQAQKNHTETLQQHHETSLKHLELSKKLNQAEQAHETLKEKVNVEYALQLLELECEPNLHQAFEVPLLQWTESPTEEPALPSKEELFPETGPQWTKIERHIKQLRQMLKSLGPVNLDAIQEYHQVHERLRFLLEQKEDLDEAQAQLLQAMEHVNRLSSDLFGQTFSKIRTHFQQTFQQLFGGGQADITLDDPENLLESGIEITACPPGTRLKSLTLLSGGQKTMTAVALLFSIYLVKPSPFCVLDELDAPLDDANIGRFTALLRSFTEFSQFLVITHNKRTLSAADLVYGVTMPEKGVTQMVSLDFSEKQAV